MKKFIGVDLHSNNFTAAFMVNGIINEVKKFEINQEGFSEFESKLSKIDEIALEAVQNTRFFYDRFSSRVDKIAVVNPYQFRVIAQSTNKNDLNDAKKLALFLSKSLLPTTRLKPYLQTRILSLANTRAGYVKSRVAFNNKTWSILNSHGKILEKRKLRNKTGYQKYVFCYEWEEIVEEELRSIYRSVKVLSDEIELIENKIEELGGQLYGYENLLSIPGMGKLSAAIILSIIGDINDFSSHKKLASYFGLVPSIRQSNENIKYGSITKRGTRMGRTTLIQSMWTATRFSSTIKNYYVKQKDSKKVTGKAAVATANKYLKIIFETLKYNRMFTDFEKFEYEIRN